MASDFKMAAKTGIFDFYRNWANLMSFWIKSGMRIQIMTLLVTSNIFLTLKFNMVAVNNAMFLTI